MYSILPGMDSITAQAARTRTPLTNAELVALYHACRTPEMRAALWEIARLQERLTALWLLAEDLLRDPGSRKAELLASLAHWEPCVATMLDREWETRWTPFTRYYARKEERGQRPAYRPPWPTRKKEEK